jgi:N-acetylglucosamine malate deacetylase 2
MFNFVQRRKVLTGIAIAVALLVLIPLLILNWMFEEPGARKVSSLAHHVEAGSVLAVFAHPDDEQLVTGLLIRAAKDERIGTAALTATKGEAGTARPQISRPEDLGWVRKAEALKNTWALGVDYHSVLDFPDGGLEDITVDTLAEAVRTQMLAHTPDLIVTFWPESGFSDHADHKKMGLATEKAIADLRAAPLEGYAGPSHIAYILAPTRMMSRLAGESGKRVVANQPETNFAMPGEAWAKLRGWKIHASQRYYVQAAYKMPAWFVHRLYDKEHYYLIEVRDIPKR